MERTIFEADHEAFRDTLPDLRGSAASSAPGEAHRQPRVRARDVAGAGQAAPPRTERARGLRRHRGERPAVLGGAGRGALQAGGRVLLLRRHPLRLRRPLPGGPGHGGTEAALAAGVLPGRVDHRPRHDRTLRWVGSGRPQDDGGPRGRWLAAERLQDLHHQRLLRRSGGGGRPHLAREGGPGDLPLRPRGRHARLRARPQAGQGRPARVRHRRAVLRRRLRAGRQRPGRGRRRLRLHDAATGGGADRGGGQQHRPHPARSSTRRWRT